MAANGVTRFGLTQGGIKRVEISVPPLKDQTAIARFLDYVDTRIQRFIATQEQLIELLHEEKKALIFRAVTLGIDPSAPLSSSGVGWLGEAPAHWDVRRAKWCFREIDERSVGGHEELLSVSHLTGVTPRAEKQITMFQAESYIGHKLCRPGDLVVNTMWAWMGALGISPRTGLVSPSYAVYRPRRSSVDPRYAEYLLTTPKYIAEFNRRSTGIQASRLRLYPDDFLRLPILCPPLDEQRTIVSAIDTAISGRQSIEAAVREQVHRVREYRTRLISDVVTGKLDVREVAANLPDDPDADDPALDERLEEVAAG
jgi:type I restriction enzyme S subunit